jgi:peptidoglycan biosynthesis protein MviN/MurJ (putative lipid II flippase)
VLRHSAGWPALLLQVIAANAAMWAVLAWLNRRLEWWLDVASLDRVTWLAISIAAGAGVYCVTLLVLGLRTSKLGIKPH